MPIAPPSGRKNRGTIVSLHPRCRIERMCRSRDWRWTDWRRAKCCVPEWVRKRRSARGREGGRERERDSETAHTRFPRRFRLECKSRSCGRQPSSSRSPAESSRGGKGAQPSPHPRGHPSAALEAGRAHLPPRRTFFSLLAFPSKSRYSMPGLLRHWVNLLLSTLHGYERETREAPE
jgi:hypothetical protein